MVHEIRGRNFWDTLYYIQTICWLDFIGHCFRRTRLTLNLIHLLCMVSNIRVHASARLAPCYSLIMVIFHSETAGIAGGAKRGEASEATASSRSFREFLWRSCFYAYIFSSRTTHKSLHPERLDWQKTKHHRSTEDWRTFVLLIWSIIQ